VPRDEAVGPELSEHAPENLSHDNNKERPLSFSEESDPLKKFRNRWFKRREAKDLPRPPPFFSGTPLKVFPAEIFLIAGEKFIIPSYNIFRTTS